MPSTNPSPKPQSTEVSFDDLVKKIDAKIAELEKEEEEERKKIEEQKKKEKAPAKESKKEEKISEVVAEEASEKNENDTPSSSAEVANIAPTMFTGFKDIENKKEETNEIPPMKKGEPIIDSKVSSIMVTDDQFFDDFFDE